MQFYPKSCYIHEKQSGRASTIPLNVYFFPTQTARLPQGVFSTRICASNYFASVKPIRKAATSTKNKAAGLPPYRLMFIFSQRRRHDYHMAFSLLESVRRIAPPMRIDSHHASLFWKLLHLMQNKSGRASTHTV